jgi:hypothetical protein
VYQALAGQILGAVRQGGAFGQTRAGHGDDLLARQRAGVVVGPILGLAAANAKRDAFGDQVEIALGGLQAQVYPWQRIAEPLQPRHHPEGGKGGRRRQCHMAAPGGGTQRRRRLADQAQPLGNVGKETGAGIGKLHPPVRAPEKPHAQLRLQSSYSVRNRRLTHAQFATSLGETAQPPGRLEGDQVVGRGQEAAQVFHKSSLSDA